MEIITNIIAALAAIVTVLISYIGIRKQLRADLYAHYSRLYYDLMLEMMKCDDDPERQKAVAAIYIDLCSEEFQLRKQKKVDKKTWKQWREGIQYSLHQEPYLSVWRQKVRPTITMTTSRSSLYITQCPSPVAFAGKFLSYSGYFIRLNQDPVAKNNHYFCIVIPGCP